MCRVPSECTTIIASMNELIDPLDASLKDAQSAFNGSDQERSALDKAYAAQDKLQKLLTSLEEQMVPEGYVTPVPDDYDDLPQLKGGRATVEFVLRKPGNAPFDVEGVNYPEAKMTMIIGKYSYDFCYEVILLLILDMNIIILISFMEYIQMDLLHLLLVVTL